MKLPLKTRVLEYLIEKKNNITLEKMMDDLSVEYQGDKIFRKKTIENYLLSFVGVDMLRVSKTEFDDERKLIETYEVANAGFAKEKYIPKH